MDSSHQTFFDAKIVIDDLRQRSEAVSGAGSIAKWKKTKGTKTHIKNWHQTSQKCGVEAVKENKLHSQLHLQQII